MAYNVVNYNSRWLTQPSVWSWTSTAEPFGSPTWWVSLVLRKWRGTSYRSCLQVKEGKKITGPEQLKDAAFGCARIRGDTLGIVGLGKLIWLDSESYLWTINLVWRGSCFGPRTIFRFSSRILQLNWREIFISKLGWSLTCLAGSQLPSLALDSPPLQSHPTSLCCWAAAGS